MSKQSNRKRAVFKKKKADEKLLMRAQNKSQFASAEPHPQPEDGKKEPEIRLPKSIFERAGFLGILGTIFLSIACFIQIYSHFWAIFALFVSLLIYVQALRIEIADQSKPLLIGFTIMGVILSTVLCVGLSIADVKHSTPAQETSAPPPPPMPQPQLQPMPGVNYPGQSFLMVLKVEKNTNTEENYLLDLAEKPDRNRISIYLNNDDLCFRVIDNQSQSIIIDTRQGFDTFLYDSTLLLICEYGHTNDFSFMKMIINGRKVAQKTLSEELDVRPPPAVGNAHQNLYVGGDMSKANFSRYYLGDLMIFTNTLTTNQELNLFDYFNQTYTASASANPVQPDYIDGTTVTHDQLESFFPFGYAVFYYSKNERFTYEVFTNGLQDWKIDWDSVQIEPDFSNNTAMVSVNPISSHGQAGQYEFNGTTFSSRLFLQKWAYRRIGGIDLRGKPVPYAIVLNERRENLVFAIGLRIPADNRKE